MAILDKLILGALIDGGSGINIRPLSTVENLGLKVIGSSLYVVNWADQQPITPLVKIANCQLEVRVKRYTLIFHVSKLISNKAAYPILLG